MTARTHRGSGTVQAPVTTPAAHLDFLSAAPDAYLVVATDLTIVAVSDAYLRATMTERAGILGRRVVDALPDHPGDVGAVERVRDSFERVVRERRPDALPPFRGSMRGARDQRWWTTLSTPILGADGAVAHVLVRFEDVTERRDRARQLLDTDAARVSMGRLESAIDSIEDAIALFDGEDRLVLCNSAFRRLLHAESSGVLDGKTYEEILDRWIEDIDFSDEAARIQFREQRLTLRREKTAGFEVTLRDGRRLRVIDRPTPEGGLVKTIWDLTDEKRRAEELRDAQRAAEAASAAKSDFLSSMSHELRTPLNAVLGFAQLLQRDKKEPLSVRHRDRVAQIRAGGEHLLRLIDDILDLSRIEAGQMSMSVEPVEVGQVLDEVLRTLEPMAARDGIVLEHGPLPPASTISADRTRFAQILMNLGSNAIKYNRPSGRVRFEVDTPRAGHLRISVADTGIGVPLDKQDKLFQPFQRAGQETGPIEGTGIGLMITRRLAEMMQGSVGFESTPGAGSKFWVDLPLHETQSAQPGVVAAERAIASAGAGARQLVLYVEDNPGNVSFMLDLVGMLDDIELVSVPSAELGVDLARVRHPKVVIMDINLPGMDGFEALRVLRADQETKDIPVIALTAAASERDRERGAQAGFDRYLTKPLKVDELISILEELLHPTL